MVNTLKTYLMQVVFMHTENISYSIGNVDLKGYFVYQNKFQEKRPAVIVAHAWYGQDLFARNKAHALAELGYVGFAADVYGEIAHNDDEAIALMGPLFLKRSLLLERIKAGYQQVASHPMVDPKRIGGIGFCFGGLTIIELFRSGVPLRGVVSFHGALGDERGNVKAETLPIAENIKGSILILHGHDDPLVSQQALSSIQEELTKAKIDWQLHIYGNTSHAFTNPEANNRQMGLIYNEKADKRSWESMRNFFDEIF